MTIPFNKPHMVGKELWYIAQAHHKGHLAGAGNSLIAARHGWKPKRVQKRLF